MGTESFHVEVTRFDLVLSGASRERVSEGSEKTTRCLGPGGDGAGIPKVSRLSKKRNQENLQVKEAISGCL